MGQRRLYRINERSSALEKACIDSRWKCNLLPPPLKHNGKGGGGEESGKGHPAIQKIKGKSVCRPENQLPVSRDTKAVRG